MRENEKKLNREYDKKHIDTPVLVSVGILVVFIGILIWLAICHPEALYGIRDLLITLSVLLLFIIGAALTVLFFWLSSRLGGAKDAIDRIASQADGKTEELAEKITDVFRSILEPFIEAGARSAGIRGLFTKNNTEDKSK